MKILNRVDKNTILQVTCEESKPKNFIAVLIRITHDTTAYVIERGSGLTAKDALDILEEKLAHSEMRCARLSTQRKSE